MKGPKILIALLMLNVGCSVPPHRLQPAANEKHAILETLVTRDSNAVHVALWTLKKNGIPISPEIRFDSPYSEARPKIQALCEHLQAFAEARLNALDQSLAYHWQIYSPIWSDDEWP